MSSWMRSYFFHEGRQLVIINIGEIEASIVNGNIGIKVVEIIYHPESLLLRFIY